MHDIGNSIKGAKAFSCEIGGGARTGVVLVRVDGSENRGINERGYRGVYDFIMTVEAGTEKAFSDRHQLKREHPIVDEGDALYTLLGYLDSGRIDMDEIKDGYEYSKEDVRLMHGP